MKQKQISIGTILLYVVECLRISEVWAAKAVHEIKLQKEFEDLKQQKLYGMWLKISHNSFLIASENAAQFKQRAEIAWREARKLGAEVEFDRLAANHAACATFRAAYTK